MHPSHGGRSRMHVHGCPSPIGGQSWSTWRDALLTYEGAAMHDGGAHPSRMSTRMLPGCVLVAPPRRRARPAVPPRRSRARTRSRPAVLEPPFSFSWAYSCSLLVRRARSSCARFVAIPNRTALRLAAVSAPSRGQAFVRVSSRRPSPGGCRSTHHPRP